MRVNITARDIRQGVRGNTKACPVALAIRRHKGWEEARVSLTYVYLTATHDVGAYLPSRLQSWQRDFDLGSAVHPTSFRLTSLVLGGSLVAQVFNARRES